MSTFENQNYEWRETYFVLLASSRRPKMSEVESTIRNLNDTFEISDIRTEDGTMLGSLTVIAPNESAAMDISYLQGIEVTEQLADLQRQLRPLADGKEEKEKIKRVSGCDARIDILHFEQLDNSANAADELDTMFDPGALLLVLEALVRLTDGVGVDPQSSTVY